MSKFFHGLLQVLGIGLQLFNAYGGLVPLKFQPVVAGLAAAAQGALALSQHSPAAPAK
jgi:hypothetical protein